MKKDCYNVITLYLGTSAFIITQPMRYEVAQTQKMMKYPAGIPRKPRKVISVTYCEFA